MVRINQSYFRLAMAVMASAMVVANVQAIPYASAVRNVGGTNWEFVLNEPASSITITRNGGNPVTINNPAAGRHQFDMSGFSTFEISVSKSASTGWTRISDLNNRFTHYERPNGMTVNTNPASPFFGTIYVNNGTELTTASGRPMGDGIYALTADMLGVDLPTMGVVANPDDATLAKRPPSWNVGGSVNSAWRMALDEAGNVIVTDWSDLNGGIKYANANLSGGGLILDQQAGPRFGVQNQLGEYTHGSIVSKPYVTGSVGNNLVVYAMDEDIETVPFVSNDGNSVWRWNVGNATSYDGAPELAINVGNLGNTTQGGQIFLNLNVGVLANAHYEPRFNKWYLTQNRNDGVETGLVVVTADGVDGNSPTTEWSSIQFSIDHNLDGFFDNPCLTASLGIQDIFRKAGSVSISNDGTKLFLHRQGIDATTLNDPTCGLVDYENRYLGQNSNLPGAVLVIPLDANGVPNIQVSDNGTPGDPSDDFITNMESITIASNNNNHTRTEVFVDKAGNLYTTNNVSERLEVWSPGGNTRAITRSNGTFEIQTLTGPNGDFNNDGLWNCADINALTTAIANGSTDLSFDMNGDGQITIADVTAAGTGWLAVGGANNPAQTNGNAFRPADANLSGAVDGSDFGIWNANKFTATTNWCSGNFNADGVVDGSDFGIWNANKFTSSADGTSLVPEPHALAMWLLGMTIMLRRRGR